jgi:cellulose synthase/poly-beta-1,6-N-acetylglucosamine synthase-like glycosyltransferase
MYEDLSRLFVILLNMLQTVENIALIPTIFLLLVIVSQYMILAFKPKKRIRGNYRPNVSIIIPAHNEGKYLRKTINSVLNSGYRGKKEVIVVDDGSTDNTSEILKEFKKFIKSIRTNHVGKSKALNKALRIAKYGIIVTLDGDTEIKKGSLEKLLFPLRDKKVAATTGTIRVANDKKIITWFQRVEYLYYSFYKNLCDRIDGVICASGTFSAFRKNCLGKGFSSKLYSEDIDLTLNLIKNGYKVRYVPEAIAYTFVPENVRNLLRQRSRWCKGCIQAMKKHFNLFFNRDYFGPGFYSLPMLSYWYFHALIMGILLFLQILIGYYNFYFSNGNFFSFEVAKYFFFWFSVFGVVNLAYQMLIGNFQVKLLYILNILVVVLTYAIYLYSIKWSKEKFTLKDFFVFMFFFPYWILIMVVQSLSNAEWFVSKARNWWKK